jgi:uncharacterized RDD family membrane protein YckC
MSIEDLYARYPKVPMERRVAAFLIDFFGVWLVSSFVAGLLSRAIVFFLLWLVLRVVLVSSNQGQSLGRWALDLKVLDSRGRIPDLLTLGKREGLLGLSAALATVGLTIGLANGISLLLLSAPLVADCGVAFADSEAQQAFHDRIAGTIVIQTRRGFSLDIRLKKFLAQVRRRVQK